MPIFRGCPCWGHSGVSRALAPTSAGGRQNGGSFGGCHRSLLFLVPLHCEPALPPGVLFVSYGVRGVPLENARMGVDTR